MMSAHRIAFALLPLCVSIALTACASATSPPPASASAPGEPNAAAPASTPASGTLQAAREDTRRLHVDELRNTGGWALRSATAADGARIAELFPESAPEGVVPTLEFDLERVSAYAGCNRISGTYRIARDSITLDLSTMTKMGCPDPLNRADAALSEGLRGRFRAELLEGMPLRLRLTAEDGRVYMFEAQPMRL